MSNVIFAKSVDSFVGMERKGANAFGTLVEFAYLSVKDLTEDVDAGDVLGNAVKAEEAAYRVEHPKMEAFPTSYRSAKSVVLAAVKAGVSLVREDGSYKGKSELEKETKEGKSSKTPVEKFQVAMNTASAVFAKCETLEDMAQCKALLEVLAAQVVGALAEARKEAA